MQIISCADYAQASAACADIIARQLQQKPDSVLGLATGSTPLGTYRALVKMYEAGELSFKKVTTFNLDEYVGLSPAHDQSYAYFMRTNLFDLVDIDPANTNIPNGLAKDLAAECRRYDALQQSVCSGLDVQLLGIGPNGHVGFNEPDDVFTAGTHRVELAASTIDANARFFASRDEVPKSALTVGMRTILCAKKVIIVASGAAKRDAVRGMLEGPVTPRLPASILQLHPDAVLIADRAALGE
ncbi:MAG: glucosamine-6-phosphate deaminase [Oscillospiraceae bacterium]|nr:glucosamine-6-phosphate deaminase [Oscillospiraceae bacterium]